MRNKLFILSSILYAVPMLATVNLNVPDKDGITVKGLVKCGDEPVANVQVSDGVEFTKTDANGHYWLNSKKEYGYVFICNPDGYKTVQEGVYPKFYQYLTGESGSTTIERADFELEKTDDKDYAVVFVADPQLARRYYDWQQFEKQAVPDINNTIAQYQKDGKNVYCITLGDLTFNSYELLHNVAKENLDKLKPNTLYNCIGNHDHQTDVTGNWATKISYHNNFGPTNYSFNLGGVHYIILDNIEVPDGKNGEGYTENITTQVLKWFRNDLKNVDKNTPVVVCMHALLFARPQVDDNGKLQTTKYRYGFGSKFMTSLSGYKNVKVFTGHAHNNHTVTQQNVTEYNVGAVAGDIWLCGYFNENNLVCGDGSPGGYRVMEVKDGNITTYNKCIGFDRRYQFRAYDLNQCYITPEKFAPNIGDPNWMITEMKNKEWGYDATDYNEDGSAKIPNKIRVKVFAYDENWKVEMFEEGTPLTVKRISYYDPYYIISNFCQRMDQNWGSGGAPTKNSYLFDAQASSPTSTVTIRVTDENGNVFIEDMKRPKEFSIARYIAGSSEGQYSSVGNLLDDESLNSNCPVEYYTLTGMKIENPSAGIYIRKQGSKSNKVVIP